MFTVCHDSITLMNWCQSVGGQTTYFVEFYSVQQLKDVSKYGIPDSEALNITFIGGNSYSGCRFFCWQDMKY